MLIKKAEKNSDGKKDIRNPNEEEKSKEEIIKKEINKNENIQNQNINKP